MSGPGPLRSAIRPVEPADAADCGRICYEAFAHIAGRHGFSPDFPSTEAATALCSDMIEHAGFFGVVAEQDGRIVGSNFLDERSAIFAVGPITVQPDNQNRNVGRDLMRAVLDRAEQRRAVGVRLVQAAYHNRSLSLYIKLGFAVREPLVILQGEPLDFHVAGSVVRTATDADIERCNALCVKVHGHDRSGELRDSVARGTASVVERRGQVTGYATGMGTLAHAVAQNNDDVLALIGAARRIDGSGLIAPARNTALVRWCLDQGLRVAQMMTLMTMGRYHEPAGAYLPSIGY